VRLIALGGETDISIVDHIRLTYWHTYTADGDFLLCSAVGGKGYTVDGFTSSRIRIMDITDPESTYEIVGTVQAKGSSYSVGFLVPSAGERTLLVFADSQAESPGAMEANRP